MPETGLITFLTFSMTNNLININYVFIEYTYIIAKSACIQFFKSAIFLSMSWKILENFLPYKRKNIAFAFILYVSQAEIWNVKCRIHLSCCVCRGMNLYKEPGNKKRVVASSLPLHGVTYGACVAT